MFRYRYNYVQGGGVRAARFLSAFLLILVGVSTNAIARPWTPADLTNAPAAWYDASDTNTITESAGAVSQWDDKSGTRNLTQGTGSLQPSTGTRTIPASGGLNVLDFAVDSMNFPDDLLLDAPFAVFGVIGLDIVNVDRSVYTRRDSGTLGGFMLRNEAWTINLQAYQFSDLEGGASQTVTVDTPFISSVTMSGSVLENRLDGGTASTKTGITGYADGPIGAGMRLGNWDGPMAELVFLDYVPSEADRQIIEGYLAHKWGLTANLPAGHLYKTIPPPGPPDGMVIIIK